MNQTGAPAVPEYDATNQQAAPQPMEEIPSYPGEAAQYIPQETYVPPVTTQEQYATIFAPKVEQAPAPSLYNAPEAQIVPQSKTPELQTNLTYQTREGERFFSNPELGQSTFKGGVTSTQLVSKVAGYYTVNQGLVADPKSGLLQQTAQTGDPTQAVTWQSTLLFKILQAFWSALGISK